MNRFRVLAASLIALASSPAVAEEGFYQYPSARGDVLVFASEGDLWRTGRNGGSAIRLTNHQAEELDAVVSPDGKLVAFTASYDSEQDVYVMPVAGGAPRRLTFDGGMLRTVGWTPDGRVIYSSRLTGAGQGEILYTVDPQGGLASAIPLWRATDVTYGQDRRTLFFSRRGLSARRDNAALYRGGGMTQLWRWTAGSKDEATELLANFGASIRNPMAAGGRIYFISDKSGGDAVWSVAEDGSGATQLSKEMPFPVLQASLDGGDIYLQNGADIHVFSVANKSLRKLSIDIVTDREQTRLRAISDPLSQLEAARISPSGESVAVTARGRVALGAPRKLRRVEFSVPLQARARQAVAGPKGERVFMILDQGERGDIHVMRADGTGEPAPITRSYDAHIWSFAISPDGKTLVVWDKLARLQKVDIATGKVTLLATNDTGDDRPFGDLTFSPDSTHIAYAEVSRQNAGNTADIFVQNLATGARAKATSSKYHNYAPAFAHDGGWLYFLSDRNFSPKPDHPWGDRNMGVGFPDRGEIYALQLDPTAEFRFQETNELTSTAAEKAASAEPAPPKDPKEAKPEDGKKDEKPKASRIVLEGLVERLYKLPTSAGMSDFLLASKDFLYSRKGENIVSIAIDKSDPKVETFAEKAQGAELSADGKTLLVLSGGAARPKLTLAPAKAKAPDKPEPHVVRLDDWKLVVDPAAEWRQMFVDAWRLHRDFAYDPTLRGVDWKSVRTRLEPMLGRIGHRAELNTILGQMASNLGILHSQVRPGDLPKDRENADMAFLGARYTPVAGGMRIDSILRSEADLVSLRTPLRRPGVDVRVGDVIRAVDGRATPSLGALQLELASKAGQQVRLDLTRDGKAFSRIVEPMTFDGEVTASYYDFVEGRRIATQTLSDGKIGYLHLRAMGGDDVASFARDYFAQLDKDGLIIDVRNNSGGNIDSLIISMLMRKPWAYWAKPDGTGIPTTNMQNAYRGKIAVLVDERTYSDGETFAAAIRALGIGPLVGTRTAGAGIWLSDRNRLTDKGAVRVAENAQYSADGAWMIEGQGVTPDVEVENGPHATFEGRDAQLERAVALLKQEIAKDPVRPLKPKPLPAWPGSGAK